jgi:hypothetical protein
MASLSQGLTGEQAPMKPLIYKVMQLGFPLLAATVILLACVLALRANSTATASSDPPVILAEYQAWHGLPSHANPPYTSTDPLVIVHHITAAKAMSISGFVVDWYGPSLANCDDRGFMDQATADLIRQSAGQGFQVALMYDEGAIRTAETLTTAYITRMITDLLYARQYLTTPAYLNINEHPALFVFPCSDVDPYIDWSEVRARLGITITLIDKGPNPGDPQHDAYFDGFYAWVQPAASTWLTDGTEWGHDYLTWFYNVMTGLAPTYTNKVAVGGVWPGFDDSAASWGQNRYMWPRCGQTWRDTWQLANQYGPPYVMIDTWNDFEEGTSIEFGTGECLSPPRIASALPGQQAIYTHTLVNTGKFSDTFQVTLQSSNEWTSEVTTSSVTLDRHASTTLTITSAIPALTHGGVRDELNIQAISQISPSVYSTLTDTATVLFGTYLPVVTKADTQTNLLANGDFEIPPPWPWQDDMSEIQVAPGWRAWYLDQPPSYVVRPVFCNGLDSECYWTQPEFRPVSFAGYPWRVCSGSYAQKYFSYGRMHEAGLMQRVAGITPGTPLRFSVYMEAWMCNDFVQACDGGRKSQNPTTMHLKVGIDPTGGTDPFSANIVWSGEGNSFDRFTQFSVEATAQSNAVTVFTHSRPEWIDFPRMNNDIYVDDAALTIVP